MLVLIDDAQWLDVPSAEAILFAIRRLLADPVAVVIAARDGHASLLDLAGLPIHRLTGLDCAGTRELLTRAAGHAPTQAVVGRLYEATAGNPLALLEVAPVAAGVVASEIDVPVPVSRRITEAFLDRSAPLPDRTRRMLTLAAASHDGESAVIARAAAALGLDLADLAPAEAAGLVSLRVGAVEFRHPLARAASYGDAPPNNAARSTAPWPVPCPTVTRIAAPGISPPQTGPDEVVSAALQQAAERALRRSAYATSSAAFERAAHLAEDDALADQLLHAAADAGWRAGDGERTVALLDELRARPLAGTLAARVTHLHGDVLAHRGPVMEGHATLVDAAALAAQAGELELGALILADAAHACFYGGAASTMVATTRQSLALLPRTQARAPRTSAGPPTAWRW